MAQNELVEEVPIEDGEKKPEVFVYDEESANLVAAFQENEEGIKALEEIGDRVRRDFDADNDAGEQRQAEFKKDWSIFTGNLPKKSYPYENSANVHVPSAFENVTRNWMRAYTELFGDFTNVFGVSPLGPKDEEMAQLLTLHGNWQLRTQIPDFRRQMARGMLLFMFLGDVSGHSYWDPEREMNRHEILTLDELKIPYVYTSTFPDYSDVPHLTKVEMAYRHQLESRRDMWENVDKVLADTVPTLDDEPAMPAAEQAAREKGVQVEVSDETSPPNAPYKLLRYEGWLRLPNQETDRWCRAVVDHKSKAVLELLILEEPDWQDVQRYESQMQELTDYRTQMEAYQRATQEQSMAIQGLTAQAGAAAMQMGAQQASAVQMGLEQAQMMAMELQPPAPPAWSQNPDDPAEEPMPPARKPVHMFSHGVLIESLVGGAGLGYGRMQADFNRASNTAMSQFTDAATFANIPAYLACDIELPAKLAIAPGAVIKIPGIGPDELEKCLIPIKMPPANPQLIEVVRMVNEFASSSMQSPAVLSGAEGKSGETARGLTARIEQAVKQLSTITGFFANPFACQLFRNNAALNSVYLKEEELFHVAMGAGTVPQELKIGRRMYERNYHVEIKADLRFVAQSQRVQEADEMGMMIKQFPQLQTNQQFCYLAIRKMLEARKQYDLIQTLGKMPPEPMYFGMPSPPPPEVLAQQQAAAAAAPQRPQLVPGQGPPRPSPPQGGPPQQIPDPAKIAGAA